MNSSFKLFTSESVTEGHPDKVCDQISDSILDALIAKDPLARVAVETLVTTGLVHVVGEITTEAYVDVPTIVRNCVLEIGYDSSHTGFNGANCGVSVSIGSQSADIAAGVQNSLEQREGVAKDLYDKQGAGDQGSMFGYATNETPTFMPITIWLAHLIAQRLSQLRKNGDLKYLLPDGKVQVTVGYDGLVPVTIETVVVSAQHASWVDLKTLQNEIVVHVVLPILQKSNLDFSKTKFIINPGGRFEIGGPAGDAGLTGRKIIVDTYGGAARHGGGAFSGKDPSKVDRCAAYATRWVAKNIVAANLADRVEVQVAYAIGKAHPVGLYVDTFNTEKIAPERITKAVKEVFDLRPAAIIENLNLLRPIYADTAVYGHFGRENVNFTWENTDKVAALKALV